MPPRPRPKRLRDEVLLLRRTPFGESSLVVHGLARRAGRVHLMAKGAERPSSRFAYVLDLVDTLTLEWLAQPDQELGTLAAGELHVRRRRIPEDVAAWRAATTALELVDLAARPGAPEPELFDLLSLTLDRLEAGAPPELTVLAFEAAFLGIAGLAPELGACAVCGRTGDEAAPGRLPFSAGAGGVLCLAHAAEARQSGRRVGSLPRDVLALAARAATGPFPALVAAPPPAPLVLRARDFIGRFLDYHLEARPKSHRTLLAAPDRNRRTGTQP